MTTRWSGATALIMVNTAALYSRKPCAGSGGTGQRKEILSNDQVKSRLVANIYIEFLMPLTNLLKFKESNNDK